MRGSRLHGSRTYCSALNSVANGPPTYPPPRRHTSPPTYHGQGLFDSDIAAGIPYSELQKGWGVVVSTDLLLGWVIGRVVFGDGHPAIDYLLLLDVSFVHEEKT